MSVTIGRSNKRYVSFILYPHLFTRVLLPCKERSIVGLGDILVEVADDGDAVFLAELTTVERNVV